MSHNNAYPSPSAAQVGEGAGPFYAAQQAQRVPPQEELELSAQLSREIGPGNNQGVNDGQGMQQHVDQKFSQPMYPPHQMQNYPQMNTTPQGATARGFPNDTSSVDESSARKKSKVSRACDECRRKKIRCDAESDAPGHPKCSNCMRTQQICQFSRQPMKRGPSKGYIKELADRLDQVEKKVTGGGPAPFAAMSPIQSSGQNANEYGLGAEGIYGRKRTHSMSENLPAQAYAQSQMHRAHEDYQTNDGWQARDGTNEPPSAYGDVKPTAPYADMTYNNLANEYSAPTNGASQASVAASVPGSDYHLEGEHRMPLFLPGREQLLVEYYRVLHPTFPVLPNEPPNLRKILVQCPKILRDAFFGAMLMVAMRSSATFTPIDDHDHAAAKEALLAFVSPAQTHIGTRSDLEALLYLQVCVLMLIGIDMSGPANSLTIDLPARGVWFGLGIAAAQNLKLFGHGTTSDPSPDSDAEYSLNRRAFCIMTVLDRYYAMSTGNPTQIQYTSTSIIRSDRGVLGPSLFNLAKHTRILAFMAGANARELSVSQENTAQGDVFQSILLSVLNDTETDVETQTQIATMPFVDAIFQHDALLLARYVCNPLRPQPSDILGIALRLTKVLLKPDYPLNPLTHHFVGLAVQNFIDLTGMPGSKAHAINGLNSLRQAIEEKHILGSVNGSRQWERVMLDAIKAGLRAAAEPMDRANLQHLADAAVGGNDGETNLGGGGAPMGAMERVTDWSLITRSGYLTSFD
ncbi:Glucose-responsive transcription factor [Xylographa trunciseda]|nr:Glucose-responsive transcription factor [Xylographa trunciseda]